MRYTEIINEARQGHLYHWVRMAHLNHITNKNMLPASWTHYVPYYDRTLVGRSFTRNKRRIHLGYMNRVLLVFDHAKLAMNNKIFPLDADMAFLNTDMYRNKKAKIINIRDRRPRKHNNIPTEPYAEEFVIGDIENISSKLLYAVQTMPLGKSQRYINFVRWLEQNNIPLIKDLPGNRNNDKQRTDRARLHFDRLRA